MGKIWLKIYLVSSKIPAKPYLRSKTKTFIERIHCQTNQFGASDKLYIDRYEEPLVTGNEDFPCAVTLHVGVAEYKNLTEHYSALLVTA